VRYALPSDINPWNDFDIGCTVTGHPEAASTVSQAFNRRSRTYRIVAARSWSLATFIDNLRQLTPAEVPHFEAIANTMLKDAQPLAHNCSLPGDHGPVAVKAIWTFSFAASVSRVGVTSSASTSGTFVTSPSPNGTQIGAISNLRATDFRLTLTGHGGTRSLTIHIGAPLSFSHSYGSLLRTTIVVLGSSDPGCRTGTTGSLLVSAPYLATPSVRLSVCGQTYLDGKGSVSAQIKSV
jgi:hypothetical protein